MMTIFFNETGSLSETGLNAGYARAAQSRRTISPLMLSDQLMTLAQDADQAGLRPVAGDLLRLALRICDNPPAPRLGARQRLGASVGCPA
ncbi:MAG TPA: hypothetical protein PK677_02390 [Acidiphilium sp.]|nr:MAG: hypothetical protein B7Z67_00205 [Acidiphilium sp. 21-60-14]OYV92246.1 MAG: hypothetical protein B7Z57_01590 [Acidiphilium sp. 37-60-79]OZB40577.1 MAG: hypothetical protein B7X48_04220 [Acidiphilium sp. 34-60-192]HQT87385.1 hypothetical protein [Acidiphilium sp.]HQU23091.1 hypothetical protein [Acidiphilium sp.]